MSELRKDSITDRWVVVATDRSKRPHDFKIEYEPKKTGVCPFCEGNENLTPPEIVAYGRNSDKADSPGWNVRVVPNKFPAFKPGLSDENDCSDSFFTITGAKGFHEVIIETPRHETGTTALTKEEIRNIFSCLADRMKLHKKDKNIKYSLVFKNEGSAAGASLEHTHTQLVAMPIVPKHVAEELSSSKKYMEDHGKCIYCELIDKEKKQDKRIVMENERFVVISPFAARFPFETWVVPKKHYSNYEDISGENLDSLSSIFRGLLDRMKNVLNAPPFNYVIHTAPFGNNGESKDFHWHIEVMPCLTKLAGFEHGTGYYINPTSPEMAASLLRYDISQKLS